MVSLDRFGRAGNRGHGAGRTHAGADLDVVVDVVFSTMGPIIDDHVHVRDLDPCLEGASVAPHGFGVAPHSARRVFGAFPKR
jgi:hypothetical protein